MTTPAESSIAGAAWQRSPRIGFIGAGRLGKALAWSLVERGLGVVAVASSARSSAELLAARIPACAVGTLQQVIDASDLVFVTTPDSAISGVADLGTWRPGMGVVHCSGVTEVAALAAARDQGAMVGGFHPMQTFGDPSAAASSLAGCTITIEADEPLDAALVSLAQLLDCPVNRLPPGMRGRYHAAAGYTSQFINALFREASKIWQTWGATEDDAIRALLPLAKGTIASIASAGLAQGMPGPVSRGDLASVQKHVEAISHLDRELIESYRLLCALTIPLAVERGTVDAALAARFQSVLARLS